jgi:hypothetical protein
MFYRIGDTSPCCRGEQVRQSVRDFGLFVDKAHCASAELLDDAADDALDNIAVVYSRIAYNIPLKKWLTIISVPAASQKAC